jgi:hypothetical protein
VSASTTATNVRPAQLLKTRAMFNRARSLRPNGNKISRSPSGRTFVYVVIHATMNDIISLSSGVHVGRPPIRREGALPRGDCPKSRDARIRFLDQTNGFKRRPADVCARKIGRPTTFVPQPRVSHFHGTQISRQVVRRHLGAIDHRLRNRLSHDPVD